MAVDLCLKAGNRPWRAVERTFFGGRCWIRDIGTSLFEVSQSIGFRAVSGQIFFGGQYRTRHNGRHNFV